MIKLRKNYQFFTVWWLKSLPPALANMNATQRMLYYDKEHYYLRLYFGKSKCLIYDSDCNKEVVAMQKINTKNIVM